MLKNRIICGINSTPGTRGLKQPPSNGPSEPLDAYPQSKPTRAYHNLYIDVENACATDQHDLRVSFTWPSSTKSDFFSSFSFSKGVGGSGGSLIFAEKKKKSNVPLGACFLVFLEAYGRGGHGEDRYSMLSRLCSCDRSLQYRRRPRVCQCFASAHESVDSLVLGCF